MTDLISWISDPTGQFSVGISRSSIGANTRPVSFVFGIPLLPPEPKMEFIHYDDVHGEYVEVPSNEPYWLCFRNTSDQQIEARVVKGNVIFLRMILEPQSDDCIELPSLNTSGTQIREIAVTFYCVKSETSLTGDRRKSPSYSQQPSKAEMKITVKGKDYSQINTMEEPSLLSTSRKY